MADSNITKKALASALKSLLEEMPFEKISISDICGKCGMNRKSFYYHFKDKRDLVNWIFDTEFIAVSRQKSYETNWEVLSDICEYFYANHGFYRKVLSVTGQNSFAEHFRELLLPELAAWVGGCFRSGRSTDFQINFFSDAMVMSFQRWLMEKEPLPPGEFMEQGMICMYVLSKRFEELRQELE